MAHNEGFDDPGVPDGVFIFLGVIAIIFSLVVIFQEGLGFLLTPTLQSGVGPVGIPYIFILVLGIMMIVFPVKSILKSKRNSGNDS